MEEGGTALEVEERPALVIAVEVGETDAAVLLATASELDIAPLVLDDASSNEASTAASTPEPGKVPEY